MLEVITLDAARQLLLDDFCDMHTVSERMPLTCCTGRVLHSDMLSPEDIPAFDRSTVDGWALNAADTFGCSETLPALIDNIGAVSMGETPIFSITPGECVYIPTGGQLPNGANAVVMVEYADESSGTVAIYKPAAPGANMVARGEDIRAGAPLLPAGHIIRTTDTGALAALGITSVDVSAKPRIAIISTGDELVPAESPLEGGHIRDINSPMLCEAARQYGAEPVFFGIVRDRPGHLKSALKAARRGADMIVISGASSAGEKDVAAQELASLGELLFHGLAVKPGKPAFAGRFEGIPVIGLPGHPMAAFFMFRMLARPLICSMLGTAETDRTASVTLTRAVPSNHGREELLPVRICGKAAEPLPGKSGLISILANSDGYIRIPRDLEGYPCGSQVEAVLW